MNVLYNDGDDSDYRSVAEEIAGNEGTELVASVSAVDDGPILYVTEPTTINERVVLQLQRRLREHGPNHSGFGIVTGQTPATAQALYRRGVDADGRPAPRDKHAIVLREETTDWFSYDDATTVLTGDDATVDRLAEREDELQSLSMLVHGRSMHLFFADGLLCGTPQTRPSSFDGPQPYCVDGEGTVDCPFGGNLLHADEFTVPHQFVDSCASMLPENDYEGLPVHVGMGLLEGATTLISVYRQIDSIPQLSVLHYCLLRAGYTAAERCYLLNRAAHAFRTAAYPYALFGHPAATAPVSGAGSTTVESIDGNRIVCRDIDTHVIDVTVEQSVDGQPYIRNLTDKIANAPLYTVALPSDEGVRVLIYTWGRFELDELVLELGSGPVCGEERTIATDALRNVERLRSLNYSDRKMTGQIRSIRNRLEGLGNDVHSQRYDANCHRELIPKVESLMNEISRVEERVLSTLRDRYSSFLSDDYRDGFRETATAVADRRCHCCGRPIFEKRMESATDTARRIRDTCPLCGVIADVPTREGGAERPVIEGELVPVTDDTVEVAVTFRNARDIPIRATYLPWLGTDHDDYRGADIFDPKKQTVRLDPGERRTVTFETDVSACEPNEYWLCAYVVGNLEVYQALRKMVVGTKYGHRRESAEPVTDRG